MQFGIAARQPHGVAFRQHGINQRREIRELCAQPLKTIEIGRIQEAERRVARDGNGFPRQQLRQGRRRHIVEFHGGRQSSGSGRRQQIGHVLDALREAVDLGGGQQAEMALGHGRVDVARQVAVPGDVGRQALFQQLGVIRAADAVGEGGVDRRTRPIVLEAVGDRTEAVGHRRAVDHGEDRNAEARRQFGRRRRAVKEAHDAFDEDEIGVARRLGQSAGNIGLAAHPEIDVLARRAAGDSVDLRIEEVRPALEDAHPAPEPRVQARQRGDDGRLALAGGRRSDEERRTGEFLRRHRTTTRGPASL